MGLQASSKIVVCAGHGQTGEQGVPRATARCGQVEVVSAVYMMDRRWGERALMTDERRRLGRLGLSAGPKSPTTLQYSVLYSYSTLCLAVALHRREAPEWVGLNRPMMLGSL